MRKYLPFQRSVSHICEYVLRAKPSPLSAEQAGRWTVTMLLTHSEGRRVCVCVYYLFRCTF